VGVFFCRYGCDFCGTASLEGHTGTVNSVAFSPDGRFALSGGSERDKTLRLWDLGKIEPFKPMFVVGRIRSIEEVMSLQVEYATFKEEAEKCIVEKNWMKAIAFLRKAKSIPGYERHPEVLDLWSKVGQNGLRKNLNAAWFLRILKGHIRAAKCVAFSPDGRFALSGSYGKTLRLWDIKTGKCLQTLEGHTSWVNSVAFSPDGRFALSVSHDKTLRMWDLKTGECLRTLVGHKRGVTAVAFSPDGRFALSGSWDNTLRLWDIKTGECLRTLVGHTDGVNSVAFSPDGRFALSGSHDKTLRLWDLRTGACLRTLLGHTGTVDSVAFSPDGRFALSGGGLTDKTLLMWEFDWEYDFPEETEWDEGARPYLEIFLTLRNGKWGEEDFQSLLKDLGIRGYGWLKPEGIRTKLEELAAQRKSLLI